MSINLQAIWKSNIIPPALAAKYFEALEHSKITPEPIIYCDLQGALTLNVEPVRPEHLIEDESKREWYEPDFQPNQPVVNLLNAFQQAGRKIIILYHSNLRHVREVSLGSEHFLDKFKSGEWGFKRRNVINRGEPRIGPLAELLIHSTINDHLPEPTGRFAEIEKQNREANKDRYDASMERDYAESFLIGARWEKAVSLEHPAPPTAVVAALKVTERQLKIA